MNNFNISTLEQSVADIVKGLGVSKVIYFDRPKAVTHSEDFVVVKVVGNVGDLAAFGECRVYLQLYAKDHENLKNNVKLKVMEDKVKNGFPASYDRYDGDVLVASYLFDDTPNVVGDKADDYGYHMRLINISTTIKSI